jgi:DNA replication protein DnaC
LHLEQKYDCELCNDTEFIGIEGEYSTYKPCTCQGTKRLKLIYERSGISKAFETKIFDTFVVDNKPTLIKGAYNTAKCYADTFDGISWFALLGESGAGKTHLCIAILNALMAKSIPVLYMQYRDAVSEIKNNMISRNDDNESVYQQNINRYKNAKVLYIDDLFKGSSTLADINIIFEIINHRYLNNLATIISSELSHHALLKIDKAIGGRIIEKSRGFITIFEGIELNHRLL